MNSMMMGLVAFLYEAVSALEAGGVVYGVVSVFFVKKAAYTVL